MKVGMSEILVKAIRFYVGFLGARYHIGVIDSENTLAEVLADEETQRFLFRKMERYMSDDPQQLAEEPILKENSYV